MPEFEEALEHGKIIEKIFLKNILRISTYTFQKQILNTKLKVI